MKLAMYSIKDRLNGYATPIPFVNEDLAKRYFKDHMIGNPTMSNSPEDFELHKMGEFDTEEGIFFNYDGETLVEKGVNYAK